MHHLIVRDLRNRMASLKLVSKNTLMKQGLLSFFVGVLFSTSETIAAQADLGVGVASTNSHTIGNGLISTAVFGLCGVVMAILGYKLFDLCTPGNLHKEIVENRNVAAAIVVAAVILGVSLIVVAAIVG